MNADPAIRPLPAVAPPRIRKPGAGQDVERDVPGAAQHSSTQFIIGNSSAMMEVFDQICRFASCDLTVLITGEAAPAKSWLPEPFTTAPTERKSLS
jgi:hypothetical protein